MKTKASQPVNIFHNNDILNDL